MHWPSPSAGTPCRNSSRPTSTSKETPLAEPLVLLVALVGAGDALLELAGGIVKSFLFDLFVVGVPVTCHRIYKMAIKYMID